MRVMTIGTFDVFHEGHRDLLKRCQELAKHVIIGVNSDAFVCHYKGEFPVVPQESRMASVAAYGKVVIHDPSLDSHGNPDTGEWILETFDHVLTGAGSKVLVIGSDWARRDYLAQLNITQDFLDEENISLMYARRPLDGPKSRELRRTHE
jgi:glycerol-3-phosphate cytidylyltransferase